MKKKRILLGLSAFALVGLATVLSSCDGDKKYTVKFVDGQQEITKTEVTGGYNVAVPEAPTADGKTFNGWYKDAALTDPFDFGSIINGDTTVYAAWLNEYGVTFKSGDTTYLIKPVTKGYNVAVPTAPTKEGYVFAGWYADAAFTTPFYFGTVIEADTTVYAKWVEEDKSVTVDFVANVEGIELESGATEKGGTLSALPTLADTVTNYVIEGFYTDEAFTTPFTLETVVNADMDVYVKLKAVYTISFETAQGEAPASILKQNKITVADLPSVSAEGYIFKGWAVKNTTAVLTSDVDIEADITLVAVLEAIPTIETLKANGAEVIDPNTLDASSIEDYTRRGYVDPVMKASDAKVNNNTVILPTTSDNDVIVSGEEGSKVYELTDKGNNATYFYIDSFYSKGTVEAAVDFSITNQGNSWTFLRVNGTNSVKTNAELFGLRIDGGDIKYRLNGGSVETPLAKIVAENDKTYHIYLKADLDNGKMFVAINGKAFAEIEMEDLSLDTISFVTSNSGSRTIKISGIALASDMEDADFVANIKARLAKLAEPYKKAKPDTDPVEYYYDQTEVNAIIEEATASIDAATKWSEFWVSLEVANIQFSRLKTFEEKALDEAKETAKTAITEYADSLDLSMFKEVGYKDASASEVVETSYAVEIAAVNDVIDDATTIDQITNTESGIVALFKTRIATFTNDKEDMIAYYKSAKVAALEEKYPSEVYTTEKTAYDAAFSDLTTALSTATTKADIDAALTTADTTLAAIEKDTAALRAKNLLRKYSSDQVKTLLVKDEMVDLDNHDYDGFRSQLEAVLTKHIDKFEANPDDEEGIATLYAAATADVDTEIGKIAAKTDLTVTFVSDTITIASIEHVKYKATISEPTVPAANLTVASTTEEGLKVTYKIDGYYVQDTYADLWNFDTQAITDTNNTIYVKTSVAAKEWTYVPTAQEATDYHGVVQNSSIFTATSKTQTDTSKKGSSIANGDFPFDGNNAHIDFSLTGTGFVTVEMSMKANSGGLKIDDITDSENVNTLKTFSPVTAKLSYSFAKNTVDEASYSILRTESTQHLYSISVKIEYGTPITLTQKVSDNVDDDITTQTLAGRNIQLEKLSKTGYVFDGWYETFENDTYSDLITTESITLDANKTIYAKFSPITYNVTFDSNSGSVVDSQNGIAYNGTITEPTKPTRDGFIFLDWNTKDGTNDDWGEKYDFATQLTEVPTSGSVVEITLYARWLDQNDAEKSTVTFDLNGGKYNDLTDNVVVGGATGTIYKGYSTVEELTGVTQENKGFAGWYTKNGKNSGDWGDEFDFTSFVEVDELTLYARWYDTYDVNVVASEIVWDLVDLSNSMNNSGVVPAGTYAGVFDLSLNSEVRAKKDTKNNVDTITVSFKAAKITFTTLSPNATLTLAAPAGQAKRLMALDTNITSQGETSNWTDTDTIKKQASTTVFTISTPGVHYITFDNTEHKLSSITLNNPASNYSSTITSLDAGLKIDANGKLVVNSVKANVLNSTNKLDLTSSEYKVYVDDSTDVYADEVLTTGEHKVTIKYGDYTVLNTTVTDIGDSSNNKFYNFMDTVTTDETLSFGNGVVGSKSGDGLSSCVQGDLVLDVKKNAYVIIGAYKDSNYVNYTVTHNGVTSTTQTGNYILKASVSGTVTISCGSSNYLQSIQVIYPTDDFEYNIATTTYAEGVSANQVTYQQKTLLVDNRFVVDTLTGKIGPNNASWAQFNTGTKIYVYVKEGKTISSTTYNGTATMKYTVNGVDFVEAAANAGAQTATTYTATADCLVEIAAVDGDYISTISVE